LSSAADARGKQAPAVTLTIELRVEDVVTAHFWALSRVAFFRLLAVLNALLLLASVLLALRALARGEVPPLVLALAVLPLVVFPLSIRRRARKAFGALEDAERRGTYTFDDQGFGWTLGRSPGRSGNGGPRSPADSGSARPRPPEGGREPRSPSAARRAHRPDGAVTPC
jgi:hypothetical protein